MGPWVPTPHRGRDLTSHLPIGNTLRAVTVNMKDDGSGMAGGVCATVARYACDASGAFAREVPPAIGSPFHHSADRTNVPRFEKPTGAVGSQVNSKRPVSAVASNGTTTV